MKKRMRYYIRQKWTIVEILGTHSYHGMRSWCEHHFRTEVWTASLYGGDADSRFAFKNRADAEFFTLKWG